MEYCPISVSIIAIAAGAYLLWSLPHADRETEAQVAKKPAVATDSPTPEPTEARPTKKYERESKSYPRPNAVKTNKPNVSVSQEQKEASGTNETHAAQPPGSSQPLSDMYKPVIADVEPSVVEVRNRSERGTGHGSGFIVGKDAIVTNFHVVAGAETANVVFNDGTTRPVRGVLAYSEASDLAMLSVSLAGITAPPLQLAKQLPSKGDPVLAIGSPERFSFTVTEGIVSAVRRGAEIRKAIPGFERGNDVTWIQTSAAISPRGSGGPLVNLSGKVLGLTTWSRVDPEEDIQNLNFAISAVDVRRLLKQASVVPQPLADLSDSRRQQEAEPPVPEAVIAAIAEEQRKRAERLEQLRKRGELQQQLDHLNQRMITLKQELRVIESEGATLTAARSRVIADAKSVSLQGAQINEEIQEVATKLDSLRRHYPRNEAEIAKWETHLNSLQHEAERLNALYVQLDSEARDLLAQIEYKAAERVQLQATLLQAGCQYDEIQESLE